MNEAPNQNVDDIQLKLNHRAQRKALIAKILPFCGLVFLFLVFSFTTDGNFLTSSNFINLINQCFTLTVIAVGAAFIYAAGSMDMAIGAILGMSQLIMGMLIRDTQIPFLLIVLIGVACSVVCCSITALAHVMLRVPVFVGSMCVQNICTGILTWAVEKNDVYIDYQTYSFVNTTWLKALVLLAVIGIGFYVFTYTSLGKNLKAIGGNPTAAKLSGINVGKSIWMSFIVLGICIGITSVFALVRSSQVTATSGSGTQLNILVAIVLGGFPLAGGANSKISGPIIGALMVTVLTNGLLLMGLDVAWGYFGKGILFLIVVVLTYERSNGKLVL